MKERSKLLDHSSLESRPALEMKSLEELKQEVIADGVIDSVVVVELDAVLFDDGKIDDAEAEFLFDLNNTVSGAENHPGWEALFVKAISCYILEDEGSAGEIDEIEAEWLYTKIKGDGQIDSVERSLLLSLRDQSANFPAKLESLLS